MKNSIYLTLFVLLVSFGTTQAKSKPCNCVEYQKQLAASYEKGDHKAFLKDKTEFRLMLLSERLDILEYGMGHRNLLPEAKPTLSNSIGKIKAAISELKAIKSELKTMKVEDSKTFRTMMHKISGQSGPALAYSSDVLFGNYEADKVPYFKIFGKNPGGGTGNCEEGETPPSFDCAGAGAAVNRDCLDGIQQKQECGYYSEPGADNDARYQYDLQECTTAMENTQSACQRAVESCDNNYDMNADRYDFWRRASLSCAQREISTRPGETETNTGY